MDDNKDCEHVWMTNEHGTYCPKCRSGKSNYIDFNKLELELEFDKGDLKQIQAMNPPESSEVVELPLLEGLAKHIVDLDSEIYLTDLSLKALKLARENALCAVIMEMGKHSDAQLGPYRLIRKKVYRGGYTVDPHSFEQIKILQSGKIE